MSAQGFVLGMNEMLKLDAEHGATVRVRAGCVWLTQLNDPKDHILHTGDAMPLGGGRGAIAIACQPTLLELFRHDPLALREQITRSAHRARNEGIRAFFARFFC